MRLLIIDNYDSFTFNLVQLIRECGCEDFAVIKSGKLNPHSAARYDKILLSPGAGLPKDYPAMLEVIKKFALSKSILGVCLGHQAIAEVFGAKLYNVENIFHGISKKIRVTDSAEQLFRFLPNQLEVGLYHSWAVSNREFPDDLKITSISDDGIIMSIAHKNFDLRGIQFHPESILTPHGKEIIGNWLCPAINEAG